MVTQIRTYESALSLGKETTWGSGVAPTAMLLVNDISENPQINVIRDAGLRGVGSEIFAAVQGGLWGEIGFEGFVYPEDIGYLLHMMLGGYSVSGAGPYTHTFVRGDSPPSYTVESDLKDAAANMALRYAGCRLGQLGFNFNAADSVLQFTAELMGNLPTIVTGTSPAFTVEQPWAGWRGTVTSTGFVGIVISAELTLKRELEAVHTAQNAQGPYIINVGPLGAEGKLVIVAQDLVDYTNWKANTEQPFTLEFDNGLAAAANRKITFLMTLANLSSGPFEIDRSNVGVTFGLPLLGIHNNTDGGAAKVTLINGKTTYA